MSTEARGRSIVGAASLRAEPNPPGKLGVPHTKIIRATSGQAQCHTRELRSDAGLPERRRSAELGSEKTLTPTFLPPIVQLPETLPMAAATTRARTVMSKGFWM